MGSSNSVWGNGQLLAFSGIDGTTDFDNGLTLRTEGRRAAFQIVQPGHGEIVIGPERPATCEIGSDYFIVDTAAGRTVGVLEDAWTLRIEGPVQTVVLSPEMEARTVGDVARVRSTAAPGDVADQETIDLIGKIDERRAWVERVTPPESSGTLLKAIRTLKGMIYSPEGVFERRWSTPDRWPHRGCWLWDSAFHAIGARHVDPDLARDILAAPFAGQRRNGMIPIRTDPHAVSTPRFTQPPTLTLALWCLEQLHPNQVLAEDLLPPIERYLDYDRIHRDAGNGLPYWLIEGDPDCRSGESGLDNSPRFDSATRMEAVDFASFLSLEYDLLSRIAERLGDDGLASRSRAHHLELNTLINHRLWNEEAGIYVDFDVDLGGPSPVRAATGFLPLICGAVSEAQADRLEGLIRDPEQFGTAILLPSIARSDPSYRADMWCGPVWANLVWLVAAGFDRYGRTDTATGLRESIMRAVEHHYDRHGTIFEFFDADDDTPPDQISRKGRLAPEVDPYHQVIHDFGWTAALYIDMSLSTRPVLPPIGRVSA